MRIFASVLFLLFTSVQIAEAGTLVNDIQSSGNSTRVKKSTDVQRRIGMPNFSQVYSLNNNPFERPILNYRKKLAKYEVDYVKYETKVQSIRLKQENKERKERAKREAKYAKSRQSQFKSKKNLEKKWRREWELKNGLPASENTVTTNTNTIRRDDTEFVPNPGRVDSLTGASGAKEKASINRTQEDLPFLTKKRTSSNPNSVQQSIWQHFKQAISGK